jgi:hypothetical protein
MNGNGRNDYSRQPSCSSDEAADRIGVALTRLFQAWSTAGTQMTVGTARVFANTVEDLSGRCCGADPQSTTQAPSSGTTNDRGSTERASAAGSTRRNV